jgi:hypothetical protein
MSPWVWVGGDSGTVSVWNLEGRRLRTLLTGRGLHSSTFRFNVSAFCGIGGAFSDCEGVFRRFRG